MGDTEGVLLSVRGEAVQTVAPDYAGLVCAVTVSGRPKVEALEAAARNLDALTADLESLGGVVLTVDTTLEPLTWSAHSTQTMIERFIDKETGVHGPTGMVTAVVSVTIVVRAFDRLEAVGAVFAKHASLVTQQVGWHVDPDNAGWRQVRAAAIVAAIRKGRDYASALGGTLDHVEHIADVGLLGGGADAARYAARGFAAMNGGAGGEDGAASLDPLPQELNAAIDARFVAVGVTL